MSNCSIQTSAGDAAAGVRAVSGAGDAAAGAFARGGITELVGQWLASSARGTLVGEESGTSAGGLGGSARFSFSLQLLVNALQLSLRGSTPLTKEALRLQARRQRGELRADRLPAALE